MGASGRAALLAAVVLISVPSVAHAASRDFFSVVSHGELVPRDLQRMSRANVREVRFALRWDLVQPTRGAYDWSLVDEVFARACAKKVQALPFAYGSPGWVAARPEVPPIRSQKARNAWTSFLRAVVRRYGRKGTFWKSAGRCRRISRWQIWNEPNFDLYWQPKHSAREYARLLSLSARAIRGVDPQARIAIGGLAPVVPGALPWEFLHDLYRLGAQRHFDIVAVHPYAPTLRGLRQVMRRILTTMEAANDTRTVVDISEVGWASDGPKGSPMVKGRTGQARMLRRAFRLFERRRQTWRLRSVAWFSWQDAPPGSAGEGNCSFCAYSGLFTYERKPKPAWHAFRRFTTRAP